MEKLYKIVRDKDKKSATGHVRVSIVSQLCAVRRSADEIVRRHVMKMEQFALDFIENDILSKHTRVVKNEKEWICSILNTINDNLARCTVAREVIEVVLMECGNMNNNTTLYLLSHYVRVLFQSPRVMHWIAPHFQHLISNIVDDDELQDEKELFNTLVLLLKRFAVWDHKVDETLKMTVKSIAMRDMECLSQERRKEIVDLILRVVSRREWKSYGAVVSMMYDRDDDIDMKYVLLSCLRNSSKSKSNALFVLDSLNLNGGYISDDEFQALLSLKRRKRICREAFELCDGKESSYFVVMCYVLLKLCGNKEKRLSNMLEKVSSVLIKHSEGDVDASGISTNDLLDILRRIFERVAADCEMRENVFLRTVKRIFLKLADNADIESGRNALRTFCFATEPLLKVELRIALSRLNLSFRLEVDTSDLVRSWLDGVL